MKYAKYIPELKRRETWQELVDRNKQMHIRKYPSLKEQIEINYKYVYEKKVLPSMRSLQFGGKPIEISPNRLYNCAYLPIDHIDSFSEVMYRRYSMISRVVSGGSIESNFFSWIDNSINSELILTSVFEDEDKSVVVIPFGVVNSCYLDFLDYDAMVKELRETSRNQGSYKKYEKK